MHAIPLGVALGRVAFVGAHGEAEGPIMLDGLVDVAHGKNCRQLLQLGLSHHDGYQAVEVVAASLALRPSR